MGKAVKESLRTFVIILCNYLRKPQWGCTFTQIDEGALLEE